ncbi:MAG: AAA family ATPase [Akkermansia sp.]
MAKIEGIRIKNFRTLRDVTIGKLSNSQRTAPLTPLTVVIGQNGVGKSSLFDAFGFLADALKMGVEDAFDAKGRGGFDRIRSKGEKGAIEFEIYYKEDHGSRPITYELSIDADKHGRPYVTSERLRQRRKNESSGRPFSFLILNEGKGYVWKGESEGVDIEDLSETFAFQEESPEREYVELDDARRLGIATLGALKQHSRIASFRKFMEGWYLSYFTPDAARSLPTAGPQKYLNIHGDNLGNVVQYLQREYPERLQHVLNRIADKIPDIQRIDTEVSSDNRVLLRFYSKGFTEPFYAQQMSDGTLKIFAYLLMLEDPGSPPLICIEEPENGLYHKLLEELTQCFRQRADGVKGSPQIFITTHQPYLVNALKPDEVWILSKGNDGFSKLTRASNNALVVNMAEEGLPLGNLWYSDYLDPR